MILFDLTFHYLDLFFRWWDNNKAVDDIRGGLIEITGHGGWGPKRRVRADFRRDQLHGEGTAGWTIPVALSSVLHQSREGVLVHSGIGRNGEAKKDHPKVHWFCADRRDHQDYTKSISFASRHLGISATHKWRAVIDFCAFSWRDLQSSIKPL